MAVCIVALTVLLIVSMPPVIRAHGLRYDTLAIRDSSGDLPGSTVFALLWLNLPLVRILRL